MNASFLKLEKEFKQKQKKYFCFTAGILIFLIIITIIFYLNYIKNFSSFLIFLILILVLIVLFFIFFFKLIKYHRKLIDIWDEKIFIHEKMNGLLRN